MSKPSYMELYQAQGGDCFYCGAPMGPARSNAPHQMGWTTDHFIPKCRGGQSLNKNLVLCHAICNMRKGGRWPTKAEIAKFHKLYTRIKKRRALIAQMEREARREAS